MTDPHRKTPPLKFPREPWSVHAMTDDRYFPHVRFGPGDSIQDTITMNVGGTMEIARNLARLVSQSLRMFRVIEQRYMDLAILGDPAMNEREELLRLKAILNAVRGESNAKAKVKARRRPERRKNPAPREIPKA